MYVHLCPSYSVCSPPLYVYLGDTWRMGIIYSDFFSDLSPNPRRTSRSVLANRTPVQSGRGTISNTCKKSSFPLRLQSRELGLLHTSKCLIDPVDTSASRSRINGK